MLYNSLLLDKIDTIFSSTLLIYITYKLNTITFKAVDMFPQTIKIRVS